MYELIFRVWIYLADVHSLAHAAHETWPKKLSLDEAYVHAAIAVAVETPELDAALLLATARVESGFKPEDTSRVHLDDGKRHTSKWRPQHKPDGWSGPFFCGVMQTRAESWRACIAQRSLVEGYKLGVFELTRWMKACKGDDRCALAGHGGGFRAAKRVQREAREMSMTCYEGVKPPYWMRVLWQRDLLLSRRRSLAAPAGVQ